MTLAELQEIRRIWIVEKHEIEDLVPAIYEDVIGEDYPGDPIEEDLLFDRDVLTILQEECANEGGELVYELTRNLLDVERQFRTKVNRRGLFDQLEKTVRSCFYMDESDALLRARQRAGDETPLRPLTDQDAQVDAAAVGTEDSTWS